MNTLEEAARHWEQLAENEVWGREQGIHLCPEASRARENSYRRTAQALRIQIETGVPVCSCCHKPFSKEEIK